MSATASKGPTRHRVPVDREAPIRPPRLGKIRLGVQAETTKNGRTVTYPKAVDYFRVDTDESGITSPAAVEAFREVYGEQPKTLHVMLFHDQVEHVLESAWRLYGASKLKRICSGTECSVRLEGGGWEHGPCRCAAEGLALDDRGHCQLTHTLWLGLPDLRLAPGLWELDTGSEISERELRDYLLFVEKHRGSLLGFEFDLALVPTPVAPDGKSKTVYTLHPVSVETGRTFREVIDERSAAPQLGAGDRRQLEPPPAPEIDAERDPLISPTAQEQDAALEAEAQTVPLVTAISERYKALSEADRVDLKQLAWGGRSGMTARTLAERYGEEARDLEALLAELRARASEADSSSAEDGAGTSAPAPPSDAHAQEELPVSEEPGEQQQSLDSDSVRNPE